MSFGSETHKMFLKLHAIMTFYLYGKEMLTQQYVINEIATVKYVCSYMTKGEKGMAETLKRVAKSVEMMLSKHK